MAILLILVIFPLKFPCIYKYASRNAQIKKISKETHLKIQFYIEKHVSQLLLLQIDLSAQVSLSPIGHLSAKRNTNQQIQFYPVPIIWKLFTNFYPLGLPLILEDVHQFLSLRFAFGAGASPLLWVFMGEIIPPDYKVGSPLPPSSISAIS